MKTRHQQTVCPYIRPIQVPQTKKTVTSTWGFSPTPQLHRNPAASDRLSCSANNNADIAPMAPTQTAGRPQLLAGLYRVQWATPDMCQGNKSRSKILKVPCQVYISGSWIPKVPCQVYISGSWVSKVPCQVYISGSCFPRSHDKYKFQDPESPRSHNLESPRSHKYTFQNSESPRSHDK